MNGGKRFVIHRHTREDQPVHWDLMFETGRDLLTYRLDKPAEQLSAGPVNAVRIFDHPRKFLTYEGSVNNGKGNVRIADAGTYRLISRAADRMELFLQGKIVTGRFTLRHIEADRWELAPCGTDSYNG